MRGAQTLQRAWPSWPRLGRPRRGQEGQALYVLTQQRGMQHAARAARALVCRRGVPSCRCAVVPSCRRAAVPPCKTAQHARQASHSTLTTHARPAPRPSSGLRHDPRPSRVRDHSLCLRHN
jgi:hypothetical protein